jgi:serine/threonine-protein kinase
VDSEGQDPSQARQLVWVTRDQREQPALAEARRYVYPRLSPDGRQLAVLINGDGEDIWVSHLARGTLARLTFGPASEQLLVWTPDGRDLVFSSNRGGAYNVFRQAADGSGAVERLTDNSRSQHPTGMLPDGAGILLHQVNERTGRDVMLLAARDGLQQPQSLLEGPFEERNATVSPNGRWMAYESDSSGTVNIYVRPFPDVEGGHWQVSTNGASLTRRGHPQRARRLDGPHVERWCADRDFSWAVLQRRDFPRALVRRRTGRSADCGEGNLADDGSATPIVVVQNCFEELRRLVPVN